MTRAPSAPRSNDSLRSVFIRYRPTAPASRLAIVRGYGARFAHDLTRSRWLALDMPPAAGRALAALPWVETVEIDSSGAFLTGETYPWGVDSSGARAVHGFARGAGVKIAFLDGGVRCTLLDLSQRVVGGHDWVFDSNTYCQNSEGPSSGLDHGTSVAQVLAASINGVNLVGMAPEASLYSLRVCHEGLGCSTAMIATALEWSLSHGMQVVSASIANCGEPLPHAIRDAMTALYQANVVQVWAGGNGVVDCGNTEKVSSFTSMPGVIAVTAYVPGMPGYLETYSHNSFLDIAAPTNVQRLSLFGGYDCCFSGTSAATPHVAGAAALLLGLGFSGTDLITQRLTSTPDDRGTPGYDIYFGYGVLNVASAAAPRPLVTALTGVPTPVASAGTYWLSATITQGAPPFAVSWTVHYSNGVLPDAVTAFGANPLELAVPPGSYTITVRATPKETTYLRTGIASQFDLPVCTSNGGGGNLSARQSSSLPSLRPAALVPRPPTPNVVGGC